MVKSLLIVDDDPAQRRILEETIKRLGFETKSASSGEQALQILEGPERGRYRPRAPRPRHGRPRRHGRARQAQRQAGPAPHHRANRARLDRRRHQRHARRRRRLRRQAGLARAPRGLDQERARRSRRWPARSAASRRRSRARSPSTTSSSAAKAWSASSRSASAPPPPTSPCSSKASSGVGKELIARAIQGESERAGKPFVVVNCGAIPENLVESILFGHEKGSFTGAVDKRVGKFQEADGGTLFLDEIGELPLDAQVKLLRALQEGEIDPVGSKKPVKVDFRLISATNRNMIQLVRDGKFREDLYYRLNVFPIWVPPLRERLGDVAELAQHFMARFAAEEGKRISGISDDALRLLKSYPWPGNVRQLENAVFRAVVLADGPELTVAEFPQIAAHVTGFDDRGAGRRPRRLRSQVRSRARRCSAPRTSSRRRWRSASDGGDSALGIPVVTEAGDIRPLDEIEADMIRLALGRYRGHMTEVAKRLKIGRSTLYRKMQEYGLEPRA